MVLQGSYYDLGTTNRKVDELLDIAATYDVGAIKRELQEIVPDYKPQP